MLLRARKVSGAFEKQAPERDQKLSQASKDSDVRLLIYETSSNLVTIVSRTWQSQDGMIRFPMDKNLELFFYRAAEWHQYGGRSALETYIYYVI